MATQRPKLGPTELLPTRAVTSGKPCVSEASERLCHRGERGFALVAVAITLTALSLMMAVVVQSARESVQDADSRIATLRTAAAVDAGLATVARDLSQRGFIAPTVLSQPQTIILAGVTVTASVRPEAAKIDLNTAAPELLTALLHVHNVPPTMARRYVAEILDWRDDDTIAHPSGAEAAEYLAAGRSYVPTKSGFSSVSELSLLLHGNSDLAACLAPDLTTYSGQAGLDLASASPSVHAAAILAGMAQISGSVTAQASLATGHAIESGAVFELDLTAKDNVTGRRSSRQTILRITGSAVQPVWVLSRTPVPQHDEAEAACARLAQLS